VIPGFNAQASLYRTSKTYRATHGIAEDGASAAVIPQSSWRCYCIRWSCQEWEWGADGGEVCLRWECAQSKCYLTDVSPRMP
jgi:hypothetical protein